MTEWNRPLLPLLSKTMHKHISPSGVSIQNYTPVARTDASNHANLIQWTSPTAAIICAHLLKILSKVAFAAGKGNGFDSRLRRNVCTICRYVFPAALSYVLYVGRYKLYLSMKCIMCISHTNKFCLVWAR